MAPRLLTLASNWKWPHSYLANVTDRGRLFMQFSIMFNPVDGDPSADVSALGRVKAVFRDGLRVV